MLAPNIYSNSLAHSSKTIFHKTLFVDAKLNKAQHTRSERKSTIKQTQDNVKTFPASKFTNYILWMLC